MAWTIEFSPFLSGAVLGLVAIAAAVLMAVLFWQRRRGVFIRSLSFALLILALANPHVKEDQRERQTNVVVVIVDESASQKMAGRIESHHGESGRARLQDEAPSSCLVVR